MCPPIACTDVRCRLGRLGYACLNTILRVRKPEPVFCSRTCRLDTIRKNGIEFAKDLGRRNATDLLEMIEVRLISCLSLMSRMNVNTSHAVERGEQNPLFPRIFGDVPVRVAQGARV